jgi:hypothetical protein
MDPDPNTQLERHLADMRRARRRLEEARPGANPSELAPIAFEAARQALLASLASFGIAQEENSSLMAAARSLSKAASLGCLPCRFAQIMILSLPFDDLHIGSAKLDRAIKAAMEISDNLAHFAESNPAFGAADPESSGR